MSMTGKIFKSIIAVATAVLIACFAIIFAVLYDYLTDRLTWELEQQTLFAAQGIESAGMSYFDGMQAQNRITWVGTDGQVLYDSAASEDSMENHADREEIRQAMENGTGSATRYSDTLGEKTVYFARRLSDGSVVRVSSQQHTVTLLGWGMLQPVCAVFLLTALLSAFLASRVAKWIVRPINEIDLEHPDQQQVYEELSPFLSKIHRQNRLIASQVKELTRTQKEFSAITENMSEGLLVIDAKTEVLSYNAGALRLLDVKECEIGVSVLPLNRSEPFRLAVEKALSGERCEQTFPMGNRIYRIMASPVYKDENVAGAVLLLLDVTEQEERDTLRREFTANVSHELKTPLTSISGIAEMLMNGIVKPEDVSRFGGDIYREAQRLIALVADIIKLSQLDENLIPMEKEPVDLYDLAQQCIGRLSDEARQHGVSFELEGDHCSVTGVRPVLEEMIFNLCDNAVKYNREGGKVVVSVVPQGEHVSLSVRDTGIGIPLEHRARVFERFYRVDKSHSRQIGGTGLGLSIVKHGAAYHNARLTLDSQEGVGTTVKILF